MFMCVCEVSSVMPNSLQSYGLYPARLPCSHGPPGKSTGGGCHALLQGIFPNQGMNPRLLSLLHWQIGFFTTSATWEAHFKSIFQTNTLSNSGLIKLLDL